ncbi:cache domain-containing protein [Desulfolutivibrio sulfoxidireducens]|uniref:cache domain-containing protein n=1 Tax=Desulfolutivibrio sulfoxidireducens TaxID=2773299 RepID=UPI00159D7DC1|nr:cache domain-containing protein [Desulfolutivibrio sulfoxidireducens]QLA16906.1 histidine kinase [Desulfolutivibrio sulfoxidireducens]
MKRFLMPLVVCCVLAATAAFASDQEQKAMELVAKAVELVKTHGVDKAVPILNDPNGGFVDGEIYVYLMKNDGLVLAHGGNPALVGKNMMGLKDSDGVEFIRVQTEQAMKAPGWVSYKWTNPTTKKLQDKASYVMAVPGMDVWAGCGVYK